MVLSWCIEERHDHISLALTTLYHSYCQLNYHRWKNSIILHTIFPFFLRSISSTTSRPQPWSDSTWTLADSTSRTRIACERSRTLPTWPRSTPWPRPVYHPSTRGWSGTSLCLACHIQSKPIRQSGLGEHLDLGQSINFQSKTLGPMLLPSLHKKIQGSDWS